MLQTPLTADGCFQTLMPSVCLLPVLKDVLAVPVFDGNEAGNHTTVMVSEVAVAQW